ncbi:MFS transporter [Staphylococcus shinii]|uniref:MFS transporter n=1 Tax=Staphylococcus shinii TaxID=2912228 RepID=UPI003F5517C0
MTYVDILKIKNFTYLLTGNFFRRSCFVMFSLQLIWFTIDLTNNSSWKLSIMVMSQTLPFILFGIFGGAFSDKHNKKKILYLSDLILAFIILSIPLLSLIGQLNYITLLIISTVITILNCFTDPAFRALLPEIVSKESLSTSNALIDSLQRGSNIILPALIGVLVILVGNVGIFYICSLLLFLGFIANALIKYKPSQTSEKTNAKEDFSESWQFIKRSKEIPYIIIIQFLCILINIGVWRVALPLFIAKSLEEGVGVYGLATSFLGVAPLLTSLIVGLLSEKYIIFKFSLGVFIWGAWLLIIGMFPHTLVLYVAAILVGVGQSVEGLTRSIAIQTKTPNHLMGKVFSLSSTSNYAADTLSLGFISLVIPLITLGGVFTSGGIIITLLSFIGIRYSSKIIK